MKKEDTKVKCPKCKRDSLRETEMVEGALGARRKVIITYCTTCPFKNEHRIKISQEQYMREKEEELD